MFLLLQKFRNLKGGLPLIYFSILSIFLYFFRFNVDLHHDGIMFAPAVAFSEGLLPNRDFFAFYGPGAPIIHGINLMIFGEYVYVLRVFTAILLTVTTYLIYELCKKFISQKISLLASISWALGLASNLPWASVITTLLTLISFRFYLFSIRDNKNSTLGLSIASILLVLGTYVRIQLFIISIAVLLALIFIPNRKKKVAVWALSTLTSHLLIIISMMHSNVFQYFVQDNINFPRAAAIKDSYSLSYILGLVWFPVIFIFFILLALFFRSLDAITLNLRIKRMTLCLIAVAFALVIFVSSNISRTGFVSYRNPKIIIRDGSWMLVCGIGYFAAFALIIMGFRLVYNYRTLKYSQQDFNIENLFGIVYGLASMVQLYPVYDRIHLWYLAPIFIVALVSLIPYLNFDIKKILKMNLTSVLSYIFIMLFTLQVMTLIMISTEVRSEYKTPIFAGMLGNTKQVLLVDRTFSGLIVHQGNYKGIFDCNPGMYSVYNGKYMADSSAFVNWGPKYPEIELDSKSIFKCDATKVQIDNLVGGGWNIEYQEKVPGVRTDESTQLYNVLFSRK